MSTVVIRMGTGDLTVWRQFHGVSPCQVVEKYKINTHSIYLACDELIAVPAWWLHRNTDICYESNKVRNVTETS